MADVIQIIEWEKGADLSLLHFLLNCILQESAEPNFSFHGENFLLCGT
jgi:hypothetical protein